MESLLAHLARKERDRLDVKRIDVEKRPEAAAKMKVEVVPTLLLIKEKRVVGRLEGRVSAPKIEQMIEPHLRRADRRLELGFRAGRSRRGRTPPRARRRPRGGRT